MGETTHFRSLIRVCLPESRCFLTTLAAKASEDTKIGPDLCPCEVAARLNAVMADNPMNAVLNTPRSTT